MRGRGGRHNAGARGGRQTNAAMLRNQIVSSQMTNSVRRLQKDYKELKEAAVPLVGVSAAPLDDNFFVWHANLRGPEQSAYYGGVFHLSIAFPQNYPLSPPTISLKTEVPHPNVFGRSLCLDMLQTKTKTSSWYDGWTSAYTVEAVLIQLQSFLFEVPRKMRDIDKIKDNESMSSYGNADDRNKYKKAVDLANEYKCEECRHRGPIEPYPPFNEREDERDAFVILREPKQLLAEEFLCYHSRSRLPEVALGIGVSLSRLPRTGEIRSVLPTLDLLSLRAFTKQKVRKSIDNQRFTHWLPLYFGEREPFQTAEQYFDEEEKEFKTKTRTIDPRQRLETLLRHSLSFIAKGTTTKELNSDMILEIMPKLIITHMVEMASERKHISILALRRLINFIRLFRLTIELVPGVMEAINEKLRIFKEEADKRVKDFTPSLGDILAMSMVSDKYTMMELLEPYLEEQLDRQAFWIIRQVPELDHTDEKYKNKHVVLEDARAEVCFKTGMAGFQITMLFFSLTELLISQFNKNWKAFEDSVDDNFGCLPLAIEDELQAKFKKIQRVDNFQKYYTWIGVDCPDSEALGLRLHRAITNSKAKRYHGSSEHMNELPKIDEQIKEYIMAEPSPFIHYDEATKKFLDGVNPAWKQACMKKFDWIRRLVEQNIETQTPISLALASDNKSLDGPAKQSLTQQILARQQPGYAGKESENATIYEDYPASFSWRDLYHKLCFEQMQSNFDRILDFEVFYEYINKLGSQIEVLKVVTLDKTKLKSNHYWVMVLLNKLTKLRVIKFEGNQTVSIGPDFFKFLVKGINYVAKEGRQIEKFQMNGILGYNNNDDNLYPFLKPNTNLVSIDVSKSKLTKEDARALGKVLADFRQVRELNLNNSGLSTAQTKEIADGLMRAKQLEVLKLANNPNMSTALENVIYNLAFSPKIRHIDLQDSKAGNSNVAEAIYKLIKISGAIEHLNLCNTGLQALLTAEFYKALGENKTLKYLNLACTSSVSSSQAAQVGKAVAMNAYRNGALEGLVLVGWFNNSSKLNSFINALCISNKDHEEMYGDKKLASEMEKKDLETSMYFNLKFLNLRGCTISGGMTFNYKNLQKQQNPEWPKILELATKTDLMLNLKKCSLGQKDIETIAYMLNENPFGASKLTHLSLQQNPFKGEGAKLLAPALKANTSLTFLNLSGCKLGVSGMVSLCDALKTNNTLQSLSLYRNIFDVDGARALGTTLKTNTSLRFLDLGHNRIRMTGLKCIVEGILANPGSMVSEMSIKWNFINDEGFSYLFEQMVLPKQGRVAQLKNLWIKNNFMSEYHKVDLYNKIIAANLVGTIYVDDFENVNLLTKEYIDRSIWVAPMPKAMLEQEAAVARFFSKQHECGFVVDVRMGKGRTVPGRTRDNVYCIVEYAHENSVPRSLKLASKKLAKFNGQPVRIYKAGTKTAVNMPSQRRRGL